MAVSPLLLLLVATLVAARGVSLVKVGGNTYIAVNANFGPRFPVRPGIAWTVDAASPLLACDPINMVPGQLVLVERDNCSYVTKIRNAQTAGAAAVLVINSQGGEQASIMASDGTDGNITIPAAMVSRKDGTHILNNHIGDTATVYPYVRPTFDASLIFLLFIASGTVAGGAYWSSAKERAESYHAHHVPDDDIRDEDINYMSFPAALSFIVMASAGLLVLFFFIDYLIYVLIAVFTFGGANSMMLTFAPAVRKVAPQTRHNIQVPVIGSSEVAYLILFPICYGMAVFWAVTRNEDYGWFLQNVMGCCLLLTVQRVLRLPNIKVSTTLLSLAFVYDIFWVFLSPYFFTKSVMVTVATGGDSGEAIPLLFKVPRLYDELGGYSLLGFGDIALPGLFISYLLRYDYTIRLRGWTGYFPISMVGYVVGLGITYVALAATGEGQPALLYIVPMTLGVILPLAKYRGDLQHMWLGDVQEKGSESIEELATATV